MEEIFSEGQRRIRSKHVSLPYHRPKQRSLDEFLQRHSLVAAVPLRTSANELKEVWKQIEEKEKDAELFYKSEDESENEDCCDPSEKNNKDSQTQEALNSDTPSNENDLNVVNTAEKEDKTSDCPSNDKASPLKSSPAGNSEQTENTVNVSTKLSEKFIEPTSTASSQCEDSASFSLKLSDKLSDVNSAESAQCEDSAALSLRLSDSNESGVTESVEAINPLVIDSTNTFCGDVDTSPKKVSDESHLEDAEKETDLKINNKASSVDAQKVDETATLTKDKEIQGKAVSAEEKGLDSNSKSCKESCENPEVSEKEKVGEIYKQVSDLMPESDPTFSLQLDESQDGLEAGGNAGFKGTEEEKPTVKDKAADKKESSAKVDWKRSMKFSSDEESDNEVAPKITLKSNSQDIILLDEPIQRVNPGVAELMEKFYKHSSFKNVHKKKQSSVQMSIVTTSKNEDNKISGFHSETLTVDVEEEVNIGPKNEKPGAKLTKLKLELREQMAKRRHEEWQKRLLEHKVNEEDAEDEKSDCGALLDDDDDYVPPGTESEDSDLEENDIDLSDKKKKKSAFVDDEAEEDEEVEEAEESDDDLELSSCKRKTKDLSKEKVITEDDEYEGDDDNDDDDDDNDSNKDKDESKDEDDDWMQPGQTKLRSQLSPCVLTNNPASKVDDICLDDSKFNSSFDLSKFGSFTDDLSSNKTLSHEICGIEKLINVKNSDNATESQVLELCSGKFQTQPPQIEDETDDFVLSPTQEKSQSQSSTAKKSDPFLSSDDEDGEELTVTRKKKVVLKISDDEDETNDSKKDGLEEGSNVGSEKADLEEDDVNEDDDFPEENEEDNDNQSVMYDSEENEVIVTKKDVGQFFDKEAELSGSDVDSEDEDEKGLDRMDEELGDREQIDEDEAREELGKIHMRKLLDDDQRDIKALQERFLEDGELHSDGKGREKNFRWQNINDEALDAIWRERRNSDCEEPEEEEQGADESEQLWQKMRAEREAFLKKHRKAQSNVDEDLDEEVMNQIVQRKSVGEQTPSTKIPVIKAGAVVSTEGSRFSSINPDRKKLIDLDEPILDKNLTPASILQTSLNLYARKGSFLSRSNQILSRVGQIQSAASTEPNVNQRAKNNRNFVFATKSPSKADCEDSQDNSNVNKRKSTPVSPVANKKPKFMEEKIYGGIMPSKCKSLLAQLSAMDKEAVH